MGRGRKKKTVGLTRDEITAWVENLTGKSKVQIGKEMGVAPRTVRHWVQTAEQELQTPENVEAIRNRLFLLAPMAHTAIEDGLTRGDAKDRAHIALRLMAGLMILSERKEIVTDERPKTPAELEGQIINLVGPPATGTDPTD